MPLLHRLLTVLLLVAAAFAVGQFTASATTSGSTAYIGGVEVDRKAPLEVTLFNTTNAEMTLDLLVRSVDDHVGDPDTVLVDRPASLTLGPRQTLIVDVGDELARDLPKKTKAYRGRVAVEVCGDAPFGPDTVAVHATQFFGNRKRPKSAYVVEPLFRDTLE